MKKRVFIGIIAALMLFAFTACDSDPNNVAAQYSYVEATTTQEYLVGEKPAVSDFTFTAYTFDGKASVKVPAKQMILSDDKAFTTAGTQSVAFEWGTMNVYGVAEVKVYDVDKITVDAENAEVTTYYASSDADYQKVSKAGVTVTATYNGTHTKDVTDEATFQIGAMDKTATTVFVPNGMSWNSGESKLEGTYAYPIAAVADTDYLVGVTFAGLTKTYDVEFVNNQIEAIKFDVDDDLIFYYAAGSGSSSVNVSTDYAKFIKVKADMINGETQDVTAKVKFAVKPSEGDATYGVAGTLPSLPDMASSVVLLAMYDGADAVNTYVPAAIESRSITVAEDKKVGIEASGTVTDFKLDTDYSADAENVIRTNLSGLTVKYVMASDELLERDASGTALNLNPESGNGYTIETMYSADDGFEVGMKRNITVTATENSAWTDTIDVTLAASK